MTNIGVFLFWILHLPIWQVVFIKDQMKWSIMNVLKMLPQMPSSIMFLGTSWLVHAAYVANELAALHLNGWLALTTAVKTF